jgi:sulfatase modifying factor 1
MTAQSSLPSSTDARAQRVSMEWIPGGTFTMGSDKHYREEAPTHPVTLDGFWIDRWPVTNALFRRFVEETGYVTQAELPPDPAQYPGADPALLYRHRSCS